MVFTVKIISLIFIFFEYISNYDIYEHSEELLFKKNYQITLISKLETNLNTIEINNKSFYYFNKSDENFENIIVNYTPIIYFEHINDFFESKNIIQNYPNCIDAIIINYNNTKYINNININEIYIFLYNDNDYNYIIKNNYSYFNINNTCSIKISIIFKIDIISKKLSLFIFIFILLLLIFWIFIYINSIINRQNLFVHSTLLVIIILYLIHSILFLKWINCFDYKNFENNYNWWNILFIFVRILFFLIKILIGFCICIQLNIIELREHYNLIKESKSPIFHMAIIAFIISLENYPSLLNNKKIYISISEVFNFLYYLFIITIFFFRYSKIRIIINRRIIDSYPERGLDVPSLLIKKNIIIRHFYISIFLSIIIILVYLCITFFLKDYKNLKMSILLMHYNDILLLIGLMIVYFPTKINNYYIEYSFLEGFDYFKKKINRKNIIIYRKLNHMDNDEEENLLIKNDLDLSLVENPFYNEENDDNEVDINEKENNNNYINMKKIKIAYRYNELNEKIENEIKLIISSNKN